MTTPTQAQLDEFGRRLRTLEAEFEQLKLQVTAEPEPPPVSAPHPPVVFDRLAHARHLLDVGAVRKAVRELERQRAKSLDAGSISELEEILVLARVASSSNSASAQRLVYAIEQNIRFLRRAMPEPAVGWSREAQQPGEAAEQPAAPEPAPARPRALRPDLPHILARMDPEEIERVLAQLERAREQAVVDQSLVRLHEIIDVLGVMPPELPERTRAVFHRIATHAQENIQALQQQKRPAPIEPRPPRVTPTYQQPPVEPPPPREPLFTLPRLPEFELSDLLGARALALVGGVVTLLGIVFFFVLAVNRGWIGPVGRVSLGGGAALCVFLGGLELRRRYGETHSALAAVGAGIAGGYATLLSAAALYDLLPDYAALGVAAAIAATGLATSLRWRSQIVAGLGLIGAMLVPVAVIAQGGLSPLGTAFVALVFAATAAVALWLRWRELLVAGVLVSLPQILAVVFQTKYHAQSPWRIVLLAAVFSLLYVCTGIGYQLRADRGGISQMATSLTLGGGILAAGSALRLFGTTEQQGYALLAIAVFYALAGSFFFTRRGTRDLSSLLTFAALTVGAFALAGLLSGQPLAYAWAAEAAALAWLSRRTRELRFQIWSGVYLVLVLVHVLAIDSPPIRLFVAASRTVAGAPTAVAFAGAAAVFAFYARPWTDRSAPSGGLERLFAGFFDRFAELQPLLRSVALWLAGIFATFALSLGTLALFANFDWGWVALAGIWGLIGLGIVVAGLRLDSSQLRTGGLVWLAVIGSTIVLHGISLATEPRSWSFLVLAAALFAAGLAYQFLDVSPKPLRMDIAAQLAGVAIVIAAFPTAGLLSGQPLAYTWAGEAAALAWTARRLRAPHVQALAIAPLGLALIHVLVLDAPPHQLLVASDHPARGALTAVAIAIAAGVIAAHSGAWRRDVRAYEALADPMSMLVRNQRAVRSASVWFAGVVATYALSLGTLAPFSTFDWGYVALAGIWSLLGLAVLLAGLRGDSVQLRRGGLVWLAATTFLVVAEGFRELAQAPRSWSFLVTATGLLVAGLAYGLRIRRVPLEPAAVGATLASLGLTCYSIATLLHGKSQGVALLGLAILYGSIAAALFRRPAYRDLTTMFWGIALVLGGVADASLLDGTYRVLGWAAAGAALAWLSARVGERRFLIGASGYLAIALGRAAILQAPPSHLFSERLHPAAGSAAILIVAVSLATFAYFAAHELKLLQRGGSAPWWIADALAVYGLSLLIMELVARISNASLHTEFQRGQTAVSAFWGVLGLVLLYTGLKRRWGSLRLAGLALFAVSLGKIFLYDLPSLSSITRALSFLAVGAVLLLGGFFYQRLSADRDERPTEAGGVKP